MEINWPGIFLNYQPNEMERTIQTGLSQVEAEAMRQRIEGRISGEQLKEDNLYFFDVKLINVYELEQQEIQSKKNEWEEKIKGVDRIALRVAIVGGMVIVGGVYYFAQGKAKPFFFVLPPAASYLSYRVLKAYGRSYFPEVSIKETVDKERPYELKIYRHQGNRICPSNFDITNDYDPLTQDEVTPERLHSPHMIFLSNYVTDVKAFVKAVLKKGDIRDVVYNRDLTENEWGSVVRQITMIFRITPSAFYSCFDDEVLLEEKEVDYRGVDKEGNYTADAKAAIEYSYRNLDRNLEESSIKAIDTFFDKIVFWLSTLVENLQNNAPFREEFDKYVRLAQLPGSAPILDQQFSHLFMLNGSTNTVFSCMIGEAPYSRTVYLKHFFELITFENYGPCSYQDKAHKKINKLKIAYKREIRLEILRLTPFNFDRYKEDRGDVRIKRFETLTGVSLAEI